MTTDEKRKVLENFKQEDDVTLLLKYIGLVLLWRMGEKGTGIYGGRQMSRGKQTNRI